MISINDIKQLVTNVVMVSKYHCATVVVYKHKTKGDYRISGIVFDLLENDIEYDCDEYFKDNRCDREGKEVVYEKYTSFDTDVIPEPAYNKAKFEFNIWYLSEMLDQELSWQ